ncbi:MAG: hypothetical protein AUI10_00675 [Actinobacteria bacterium 13_2_20CM_2_72_6]|jgi:hypothetical protein|nr:MAG: hypothetical protein AUI10_00675 [Actinobacteria bacterium 13_2_20CM_2_72_6]
MRIGRALAAITLIAAAGVAAVAVAGPVAGLNLNLASDNGPLGHDDGAKADEIHFQLALSSDALRKCFPHARVNVSVALRTDQIGKDVIKIDASGLPAKTSFTAFFLEVPAAPFGAAQYFGDVNTDKYGKAHAQFDLIVQEAFASTIVDGTRVRVDLNHMGMWFADPADDDSCFGDGKGPITPFDGDNEAGAQIFNSANSLPGAPLPAP